MSQSQERKIRTLTPEVKIVDAKNGVCDYVASDETLDAYNEIILAKGWRFDLFKKNAPFVESHNYFSIDRLIGYVTDFSMDKDKLVERVKWAVDVPNNTLAQLGWAMTEKGYLRAVSVGFFATGYAYPGSPGWAEACKAAGVTPDNVGNVRCIYTEQQQIELSACIIGANPNALAKAYAARDIGEEHLAALGIDDAESFEFLQASAKLFDRQDADPTLRMRATRELRALYDHKSFAKKSGGNLLTQQPASDGADESQRREAFLRQLQTATKTL